MDKVKSIHNFPELSNAGKFKSIISLITRRLYGFAIKVTPFKHLLRKGIEFI